ncbi:hypothetical protein [Kutzneria albida]|uniref:Uncharacterized protein n=1 Tax=Kutzneria albida DSM 43870 TaxID=1449976 RepID=W5WJE9_9PSEU|nr:hypothetical protein [Kutzneria albida]AHI01003.1 hypothetical protein KALB_7645 [Kutzneria albida DSM 43870]
MPEIPVPQEIRESVLRELYRQADSLDWEDVPVRQKTTHYRHWVEDPSIGGKLADYYTAEGMRVWLKDGPLKEYARALENFGPYAKYASRRLAPPSEFITEILGNSWTVLSESIREKPMHCLITDGRERRYVCWGRPRTFRDLLWAAVNKAVGSTSRPLIVAYLTDGKTVSDSQKSLHQKIAAHCELDLAYVYRRWEDTPAS